MTVRNFSMGLVICTLAMAILMPRAGALEPKADEKKLIKSCEKNLCTLVTKKAPSKGDLACSLSKTWGKKAMKQGSASKKISWGFGDARCEVDLKVSRAVILEALDKSEQMLELPQHTVHCQVERDSSIDKVRLTLAPRIQFKNGKAKKAWINLQKVEGPGSIKGLVWTVAKLEDSIGIFHRDMIKGINKFIGETCPKVALAP